jgi:hypothetical protein
MVRRYVGATDVPRTPPESDSFVFMTYATRSAHCWQ